MIPAFVKSKSTQQLISYYKKTSIVVIILILLLLQLLVFAIYGLLYKENKPVNISILVVCLFCFGALTYQFKLLRAIKKELKNR